MINSLFFLVLLLPFSLFAQDSLKIKLSVFLDEWHDDAARADINTISAEVKTKLWWGRAVVGKKKLSDDYSRPTTFLLAG